MNIQQIKYFHLKGTSILIEPHENGRWGTVERTTEQMLKDKMFEPLCTQAQVWKKKSMLPTEVILTEKIITERMVKQNTIQRFWSKIKFDMPHKCWEWRIVNRGYPYFDNSRASRYMFSQIHGNLEDELFVLHKCDNPKCVNPNHLFKGTAQDNSIDMVRKGRHWNSKKNLKTRHKNKK